MPNPVMQWQILTRQPELLEKFYSKLFGWTISSDNPLGYRQVETNCKQGIHGGIWPISEKDGHSMVQLFVHVDNVKEYVERAAELGAHIAIPPQKLPQGEEMAVLVDPDGIPFGLFKSAAGGAGVE